MQTLKIINIWDAYCGWCFGFEPVLLEFYKQHSELELEIVSGGLFIGNRVQPLSTMPFIKEANQKIEQIFNITFGDKYNQLVDEGSFQLNSVHPAAVFYAYKQKLTGVDLLELATHMQQAFFKDGKSLSSPETYIDITKGTSMENLLTKKELEVILKTEQEATTDFQRARDLGVTSYPTVLMTDGKSIIDLRGEAMTLQDLENNYLKIQQYFFNN